MRIYGDYVSGEKYLENEMAIELKKFAYLPREEFIEKFFELKLKYEEE